ncbi:unnamed protein product [Peronospora destructor]|uniref:Uncharacterized protein n=1 Tax=Peronospora destructor TaxID=86335 RepID=A0AAV0V2E6_9STRA|nr:unnamed protein product [Peronospora destructor]
MTTPSALRQLFSFDDEKATCSSVSIDGYGTYCVRNEPVCGTAYGNCPVKGIAAIEHCTKTSQGYLTGCIAPGDAQCVSTRKNNWVCVFKDSIANGFKSKEVAQVESLSTSTESPGSSMLSGVGISLNVAVVVACCVLAFVGLVLVKKRRNRQRSNSYTLSERDISIVTL